jgi:hypothetical protein
MGQLTETVEVRAFSDDTEMNRAIQEKLEAIYADIVAAAPVASAFAVYEAACQDVSRLKKAQASLTQRGGDIFREMGEIRSRLEQATIESHAEGNPLPQTAEALQSLAALEAEHRLVMQVTSRIVERLLPGAEIVETKKAADYFAVKANSLREAAFQRIQKTAQLMVEAADHEGSIVFDSQNTVSGELRRHAGVFEERAKSYREAAQFLETKQLKLTQDLAALNTLR